MLIQGIAISELSGKNFGHDLEKLLSKSVELGLAVTAEHQSAIQLANQAIRDNYRDKYIETGHRTIVLPEVLSAICSSVNQQIGGPIYRANGLRRSLTPI